MKPRIVFGNEIYVAAAIIAEGLAAKWIGMAANPAGPFELYSSQVAMDELKSTLIDQVHHLKVKSRNSWTIYHKR